MADPLSIIASVVGLVQVTAHISKLAYQMYSSGKEAPKSISRISEEMNHLHIIFRQVQRIIEGHEKKRLKKRGLTMLPLHDLMTILTGCVLSYSSLEKALSEVAGLTEEDNKLAQDKNPSTGAMFIMRLKWALWKESEAEEILKDIQGHKLSLNLMLTIILSDARLDDSDDLDKLRSQVEKISDKIGESHSEIASQLRELVTKQHDNSSGCDLPTNDEDDTASTPNTPYSASLSNSATACDFDDRASIRTTATTMSFRSIRSIQIPSFTEELKKSRAYKRVSKAWDSQSVFSKDSGDSRGGWSMLSDLSLGDLSISEISVLELPITASELYDAAPYQTNTIASPKLPRWKVKWSSRGRLHEAMRTNNTFSLKTYINLGADIEETDKVGRTPLLYAAEHARRDICVLLLDRGAEIDRADSNGRTPLSYAAEHARRDICVLLLDRGAEVDRKDVNGRDSLSYAVQAGHWDVCELLLRRAVLDWRDASNHALVSYIAHAEVDFKPEGWNISDVLSDEDADVDSKDVRGRTLLSYLADHDVCNTSVMLLCHLILAKGANINSIDGSGRSPLSYAAQAKVKRRDSTLSNNICQLLVDKGANVNSVDKLQRTPLSYVAEVAKKYNFESCKILIDKGAIVDSTDDTGRTPLSYAAESAEYYSNAICQLLVDKGANVNSVDKLQRTPLSYAAEVARQNNFRSCEILIDKGAIVDSTDDTGRTPLSYAAGSQEIFTGGIYQLLVDKGANVNSIDKLQRTPLSYAAEVANHWYKVKSCEILIDKGAIVDSTDDTGRTPLSYAAGGAGNYTNDICQLLVDKGANVNSVDKLQRTPLSYAAEVAKQYNFKSCKILIDKGAIVDSTDDTGRTPLSYAAGSAGVYSYAICWLLVEKGANVNSVDHSGRTPLDYVDTEEKFDIHTFLVKKGAVSGSQKAQK